LLSKALALLPSNDQNTSTSLRLVLMTGLAKIKIMSMEYRAALQLYANTCIMLIVDQCKSNDKFYQFCDYCGFILLTSTPTSSCSYDDISQQISLIYGSGSEQLCGLCPDIRSISPHFRLFQLQNPSKASVGPSNAAAVPRSHGSVLTSTQVPKKYLHEIHLPPRYNDMAQHYRACAGACSALYAR
jgi:hypothetical protein